MLITHYFNATGVNILLFKPNFDILAKILNLKKRFRIKCG